MRVTVCPICSSTLVSSCGPVDSPILIVGEGPFQEDFKLGKVFSSAIGGILRMELAQNGLDMYSMRLTYLWKHDPVKESKRDQKEFDWHFSQLLEEAKGKRLVLLLGSEVTKIFLKSTATSISGIPMHSDLLSAEVVMGTLMPSVCISGTVGEFRMGIQKFAKKCKEMFYA